MKTERTCTDRLINNISRIFPQIYSTTSNQNKEKRKEEEEEKINIDMKNTHAREKYVFFSEVFVLRERERCKNDTRFSIKYSQLLHALLFDTDRE